MIENHWTVKFFSVVFLVPTQDFGGTVIMKISLISVILHKVVYTRERHKQKEKFKKVMSGSYKILLVVYIRTIHLIEYSYIIDKEFSNMSKVHYYEVSNKIFECLKERI